MPDIHLKYGGSTAARTLMCPAWPNVAAAAPNIDRTSSAAERGTMLHGKMEDIYERDMNLIDITGLDADDLDAVSTAYNAAETLMDELGIEDYLVEAFLQIPDTEIGGSADMILVSDSDVVILDWKFGYQPVKSTDQFLLYTLAGMQTEATADLFKGREVYSAVIQPAVSDKAYVTHHSADDIADFERRFMAAVKRSEGGEVTGNPGDHCQYCAGAPYCDAKRSQVSDFLAADPKQTADLADAMSMVGAMKEQIKAVEGEVFNMLEAGQPVPGWKLVLKRATRKFKDIEAVRKSFRYNKKVLKDMYLKEPELKSVAQIEKALKAAKIDYDLAPLIDDAAPGTTIAPETDKREAVPGKNTVPDALADIMNKAPTDA